MNIIFIFATLGLLALVYKSVRMSINQAQKGGGIGSDIFNLGKSNVKIFDIDNAVKTKFKDVAGLEEAKIEI